MPFLAFHSSPSFWVQLVDRPQQQMSIVLFEVSQLFSSAEVSSPGDIHVVSGLNWVLFSSNALCALGAVTHPSTLHRAFLMIIPPSNRS